MTTKKVLYTVAEFIAATSLSRTTVYAMLARPANDPGHLPSLRFGRAIRIPASAVDALAVSNTSTDSPSAA